VDESDASSFRTDSEHSHSHHHDDEDGADDESEDEMIRTGTLRVGGADGDEAGDDDDNSLVSEVDVCCDNNISVDEVDERDAFNDVDESNIIDEAQLETREE